MSTRIYTLEEIADIVLRRRWLILVPFAIGAAAAPLLARFEPERYRSDALIMVVPQRVPDEYVKATVTESVADRLPSMTEQILSRSRLERIIQDMDLYKGERATRVMEDVVQTMRGDVTTSAVEGKTEVNSFRVGYASDNAEIARKVTERLASLYIEQNLADRQSQADNTSQFLDTQLEDAKRRLIEQEKTLEQYRKEHAGQLPSQLQANVQTIQNANLQLQSLNESTNRAQERRLLIERQVADTRATPVPVGFVQSSAVDAPVPMSAAQQLDTARARRAALLQRFTPDHPEIVSLERTIAELSARLEGETPVGATLAVPETPVTPAEAAQRKRVLDLQAELEVIDHQLTANKKEEDRLKRTIVEYQAKVDGLPTRESELVELTRDYTTLQTAYSSLLMKRENSVIAANLEQRQVGEQFKLLDAASLPEKPYNLVKRLEVMASGSLSGLMLGLLAVGLLEYRDSSFKSRDEVLTALSLPVLASIPIMASECERRRVARRGWVKDVAGIAVLLGAVVVLVMWRLRS